MMKTLVIRSVIASVLLVAGTQGARAGQTTETPPPPDPGQPAVQPQPQTVVLSPAQLFEFAEAAKARGDYETAEQAYRALAGNPDLEIRTEARFRLGMMLADVLHRYSDAAVEFRKILDEKPRASRVRLELGRMLMLLGRPGDAAREFRAAQASGLPSDVNQVVRFYANALEALKPFGYSFGIALAPDTNINRATRSDTLGTVIGDFVLDQDAKARSGIGLMLRWQGYARIGLGKSSRLLAQVSGQGSFYREGQFNDLITLIQIGPEFQVGADRINLNASTALRWYGGTPFTRTVGASASWQHPVSAWAQIKLGASVGWDNNLVNDQQDSTDYSASFDYDRAFSAVSGAGFTLSASRSAARDPGYATTSGGIGGYIYREVGPATLVFNLGYNHLEADQRLFLYPERRVDDRYTVGIAASLRFFRLGNFVPVVQLRYERNRSTIEIYDYNRFSGEFGISAAF